MGKKVNDEGMALTSKKGRIFSCKSHIHREGAAASYFGPF